MHVPRNVYNSDSDVKISENQGYHFGGLHSKDYSILGSILGSPYSCSSYAQRHVWQLRIQQSELLVIIMIIVIKITIIIIAIVIIIIAIVIITRIVVHD